jgi:hypothetical protein
MKMSDPKEDAEKLKNELKLINELHKDLNETLDDLHELLRLSHDLRDSLKYSVGYFNQSTVKRAKVSALKWREAMGRFKEKAARIDTDLFEDVLKGEKNE